ETKAMSDKPQAKLTAKSTKKSQSTQRKIKPIIQHLSKKLIMPAILTPLLFLKEKGLGDEFKNFCTLRH
ncbi:hypothetical protein, partial [Caldithrix abyssi]